MTNPAAQRIMDHYQNDQTVVMPVATVTASAVAPTSSTSSLVINDDDTKLISIDLLQKGESITRWKNTNRWPYCIWK